MFMIDSSLCFLAQRPAFRQDSTGKERDETGLDYFGARYYSGPHGRFVSPDPLLNSGRPWQPQSWNRYAYTLNNPLKYVDPTGLYEWAESGCTSGDIDCELKFENNKQLFKSALQELKKARNSFSKKSREYKRLDNALTAYGEENEPGVTVGFDLLKGLSAGRTIPLGDLISFSVILDTSKWKSGQDASKWLACDIGHEGTHVSDLRREFAGEGSLSDFSLEYRAYETSAFVFQGLFTPPLSSSTGISMGGVASTTQSFGGSVIWNTSWIATDKAAIQSRDTRITDAVKTIYGYPETTPHNPWGD
ncbi:MAG TPA: RHS repeat-associated core domain-containing protein [Acidobacteriota bacterium]|nr:RHS repeat-associated core domain-containing protein [Acidobacteriota bacterium]